MTSPPILATQVAAGSVHTLGDGGRDGERRWTRRITGAQSVVGVGLGHFRSRDTEHTGESGLQCMDER